MGGAQGDSQPRHIGAWSNPLGSPIHAVQFSPNGKRGYFIAAVGPANPRGFNGLEIFDTSAIQARKRNPDLRLIGKVGWNDNTAR